MKAYTDLEQSKKLAEILPFESADMGYIPSEEDDNGNTLYTAEFKTEFIFDYDCCIACWSLAALLDLIPYRLDDGSDFIIEKWEDGYMATYGASCHKYGNELIDACYEMILNLHEQKLL